PSHSTLRLLATADHWGVHLLQVPRPGNGDSTVPRSRSHCELSQSYLESIISSCPFEQTQPTLTSSALCTVQNSRADRACSWIRCPVPSVLRTRRSSPRPPWTQCPFRPAGNTRSGSNIARRRRLGSSVPQPPPPLFSASASD